MVQLAELVPRLLNGKEIIAIVMDNEIGIQKRFSSNVYFLFIYSDKSQF